MRSPIALPTALCAAFGLVTASALVAEARSPVAIEGADKDTREAIQDLLPDREAPETLFEAERLAEEAAQRANAWLRSQGYYAATVTPEATEVARRGAPHHRARPALYVQGARTRVRGRCALG